MIDTEEWLAAWNSRDDDRIRELCTPDVEVHAVALSVDARLYHGHEGVCRWLAEVRQRFQARTKVETVTPIDDGAAVILGGRVHMTDETSGTPVETPFAILAHLRDDRASWIGTFLTADEARDAYSRGVTGRSTG